MSDTIKVIDKTQLLTELQLEVDSSKKGLMVLESLKEAMLPLLLTEDQQKFLTEIQKGYKADVKLLKEQNTGLITELDQGAILIDKLSTQMDELVTEQENLQLVNEKQINELTSNLLLSEANNYSYKKMSVEVKLRPFAEQLLECKSKLEVESKIKSITEIESAVMKRPSIYGVEKGITAHESIDAYLTENGVEVENGGKENLTKEKNEQANLAGVDKDSKDTK